MNQTPISRRRIGEATQQTSLEQRIGKILQPCDASASILSSLHKEAESAIAAAEQRLSSLQEQIYDPSILAEADAREAQAKLEDEVFTVNRLRTLLPRIFSHWQSRCAEEELAQYHADLDDLAPRHNEVVRRFMRVADLMGEIRDTFAAVQAMDAEASAIHGRAPSGESRRLPKVETAARNGRVSLLKEVRLVDYDSGEQTWPLKTSIASAYAGVADFRKHPDEFSPNWHRALAAEQQRLLKQEQQHEVMEQANRLQERDAFYRSFNDRKQQ